MRTDPLLLTRMLAVFLLLGVILGAGNDLLVFFRLLIPVLPRRKTPQAVLQAVQDVLLCLTAFSAVTVIFYYYNDGVARGFALLALAGGFAGYHMTLGKPFRSISIRFAAWLQKTARRVWGVLSAPVIRAVVWVGKTVRKPVAVFLGRLAEKRIRKYDSARRGYMKKLSEKGFVK